MHVACVLCIYVKSFKKTPSFTAVTSSGQTACPWRRRSSLSILALTALYKHTYLAAKSLSPRPGHCCAACHTSRCTTLNSSFEARQGLPKVPHVPLEPCTAHSSSNSQASTPCLPYSAAPRLSTIFVHCPSHAWCFCVVAPHTRTFQASLGAT